MEAYTSTLDPHTYLLTDHCLYNSIVSHLKLVPGLRACFIAEEIFFYKLSYKILHSSFRTQIINARYYKIMSIHARLYSKHLYFSQEQLRQNLNIL